MSAKIKKIPRKIPRNVRRNFCTKNIHRCKNIKVKTMNLGKNYPDIKHLKNNSTKIIKIIINCKFCHKMLQQIQNKQHH